MPERPLRRLLDTSVVIDLRRIADLLIAATALANSLPLVTRNPSDFAGLEDLIDIVEV